MDDWQLLNDYATRNSEESFRALADRYAGMVYHTALRQVRDPHVAEEITQAVFIALAQKAGNIPRQTIFCGWLFRATRYAVLNRVREDNRRRRREQMAFDMQSSDPSIEPDVLRDQITPLLDDALGLLSRADREIVMIRFFGDKSNKELAEVLGVSEDTAKKRLSRAMDRLRNVFAKRGVVVPVAMLGAVLAAGSAKAAPVGLASAVAAAAVAKVPATTATLALAKSVLNLMAWAKAKAAVTVAAGVLLAAGTAGVAVKEIEDHQFTWQDPNFTRATLQRAHAQVTVVPSKYPEVVRAIVTDIASDRGQVDKAQLMGLGISVEGMLQLANHAGGLRHVTPPNMPAARYDFIANLPTNSRGELAELIRTRYGFEARREFQLVPDALTLTIDHTNAPGFKPGGNAKWRDTMRETGSKRVLPDETMTSFANFLRSALDAPVVDKTGLRGSYDLEFTKLEQPMDDYESRIAWAKKVLLDELGLKLTTGPAQVESLVIERVSPVGNQAANTK